MIYLRKFLSTLVAFLFFVAWTSAQQQKYDPTMEKMQAAESSYGSASAGYPLQSGQPSYGASSGYAGAQSEGNGYGRTNDYDASARPETYGFNCYGKPAALYGDGNYDCRIFHVCQADGRGDTMHCPPKTKFNNYLGVCDWEFKIDRTCMPIYQEEPYNSVPENQNYKRPEAGYGARPSAGQKYR